MSSSDWWALRKKYKSFGKEKAMFSHEVGLRLALRMLRKYSQWKKIYSRHGDWDEMYSGIKDYLLRCPSSVSVAIAKEICNEYGFRTRSDYLFGGILIWGANDSQRCEIKEYYNEHCGGVDPYEDFEGC